MAFLGFFLIGGAWAVAAPYNSAPDEVDHTIRAYGVATGQIVSPPSEAKEETGAIIRAPAGLANDHCWQQTIIQPADCAAEPGGDDTIMPMASITGRYPPLYYAAVGWPLALSPDWTGILLARLISAAACAVLLAWALVDLRRWSQHGLAGVGVVAAITPMVTYLSGTINPNSLEICAGVALFAAAVAMLFAPGAQRSRPLLIHAGAAAVLLATLRPAGPLWLLVGLLALLLPVRRAVLADLWRWRPLRWWVLAATGGALAAGAWTLALDATQLAPAQGFRVSAVRLTPFQTVWTVVQAWPEVLRHTIGVLSWLDTPLPGFVYVIWPGALTALVLAGFVLARRDGRMRLAALVGAAVFVPMLLTMLMYPSVGLVIQGRYVLPVMVGLPILGTFLIQQRGVRPELARVIARTGVWLLLPLQVVALAYTMVRFQRGFPAPLPPDLGDLNPLTGSWHPPLGSVLPLACSLVGLVLIGWLTLDALPASERLGPPGTAETGPTGSEGPTAQAHRTSTGPVG